MATRAETATDESTQNSTLDRCLEVLKAAKSDSEQFAALLLVTKCARAGELDAETRRRIFNAVGFTFPNRLLFSKTTPEGCPDHLFRSLGLTLLACFCTDPSLAAHPQVLNKIPILNETLLTSCTPDSKDLIAMVEDAYQCLVGIMTSPQGVKHLVSGGTVSSLCQAYLNHNHGWKNALPILTSLLTFLPDKCWKKSNRECQCLLVRLSEEFNNEEDSRKFHLVEILPIFLPPSPVLLETLWGTDCLKHLCKGLLKVLSNKLSISQRDPALKLGACLSHIYGSSWIIVEGKAERARFLCLLVNLACVEIRMALEDPEPLDSRQAVATACYALVEMGIQECTKEEGRPMLREEQKLQLLQVMQEACGAVMFYLQQVGWERLEDPFVLASVRLLGAWLAEETSCLRQEVIRLLPFLTHYMQTWYQRGVSCRNQPKEVSEVAVLSSNWGSVWPADAIRFLLPALCHLSAEEAPRRILISEGVPALLTEYYQQQWEIFSTEVLPNDTKYAAELSLQSCYGVFLNLVVTEPTLVGQESCFLTLLKLLMQALPVQLPKEGHMILVANISTLGLMMSRLLASTAGFQESGPQEFFFAVIQFLKRSHVASSDPDTGKQHIALHQGYADVWADISELWFLGVQAFSACLPLLPWLSPLVLKSGWLQDILSLLDQVSPDSVDLELVTVLQALLMELAHSSVSCRELIQQHGGVEKANLYGMAALEQCLSEIL
ncbi:neurochondrin [Pseudophryne corroboree]|uniref:neurochondrin n=1 Tax=Pseudophryne corroboree TaxID=495146 RepID=UPI003081B624